MKTKVMAFKGKNPVRSKIVLDDQILEQIRNFNYLRCDVFHDINNKISSDLWKVRRTLRKTLKKHKFYVLTVPVVLYSSETNIMRKKDKGRIEPPEMKCLLLVR
jgi:hypothetical protein